MSAQISGGSSIEDIILSHDRRGISALRPYLPPSYCEAAARFLLERSQGSHNVALITTGFFIISAGAPETDGPPGAIALADAIDSLGLTVIFVADHRTSGLLTPGGSRKRNVIEFPIADHAVSQDFADNLLLQVKPAVTIAIERCGFSRDKKYLNMNGLDISDYTAKIDYLFLDRGNTLGIGDGGNEIGMGSLASRIRAVPGLPDDPAVTPATQLIISSVSNWGAYGLIAALSRLLQRDLLPSVDWEKELIRDLVSLGAVDGATGKKTVTVDGFDLEENARTLIGLKQLLQRDFPASP